MPTSVPLAKLKAQLAQLDALVAEGTLTGAAAKKARDDVERQIVAAVLAGDPAPTDDIAPKPPFRLLLGVAAFVLAFGLAGYAWMGHREAIGVGPGDAGAAAGDAATPADAAAQAAQIEAMVKRLAERLKSKPDDAAGWQMLGRSYTAQGKTAEALAAYKKVVELKPQDAQALADYADGMGLANNRSLDGEPEQLIAQALKLDPANVKALALAGTIAFNRAEYPKATELWQRAVQAAEPGSDFARQMQDAMNEARKRAGLPPLPMPAAPAAPAAIAQAEAAAPAAAAGANAGATVSGRLSLKDSIKAQVGADDTVFVFARAATGPRIPLAILRKKVSDLPLDFTLDDSQAMSPAARLSSAPQVVVGARVSKSGNAMPQPGDWQVLSAPMALGAKGLQLEIGEAVR